MNWFIGTLLMLVVVVALFVLAAWASAKAEVSNAPREEMFFCNKHGFIRRKHCIEFLGVPYCSICFHSRMVDAERKYGG